MKTLNETVKFFTECLKASAMTFNMSEWLSNDEGATCYTNEVKHDCGTSACLAGTVAMLLDSSSSIPVVEVCTRWVLCGKVDPTIRKCLDAMYHHPDFWEVDSLQDVTLERAISKLESIKHLTWEELHNEIY